MADEEMGKQLCRTLDEAEQKACQSVSAPGSSPHRRPRARPLRRAPRPLWRRRGCGAPRHPTVELGVLPPPEKRAQIARIDLRRHDPDCRGP